MRKISAPILALILLLLLFPASSAKAETLSGGLFLSHFDGNSQNSRTGNSGTSNAISFGSAKFDQGVIFDGTDSLYYSASGNINRSAGTVEFWYKPSYSWSSQAKTAIIFMYDDNDAVDSYLTYISIWGLGAGGGTKTGLKAEIAVDSSGVTQTLQSDASTTWNAGELHHIAITWDSSAFKLYVDGSSVDEISSPTLLDVDRDSIFVGNDMYAGPYTAVGTIDELFILNSARSAGDIANDYSATSAFSLSSEAGAAISTTDSTAPSISDIAVTNITKTTATVGWTTDENSDSFVEYGMSTAYSTLIGQDVDSVTSHLVSLAGLKYGTTYHYRVKSTDSADNQAVSSDYNFTTVDLDRVPPEVSFNPIESVYTTTTPVISGVATDNQSGVASLSYNLDGGNFIPIEGINTFSIGLELEDGNYRLQIKAIDKEGNEALSSPARFVIDTLPPSLAASSFFLGPQKLIPASDGSLVVSFGSKLKLTISAVGGPTMVQVKTNGETYSLQRIAGTNLWQGEIVFNSEGQFNLEGLSEDGAGNEVIQNLNLINVLDKGIVTDGSGEPIEEAEVLVYVWVDEASPFLTGEWQLWESEGYGQQNSQKTDKGGGFYYFLPEGKYQLIVEKDGFQDFVSQAFTVDRPTPLNLNIKLFPGLSFKVAGISIEPPWFLNFFARKQEINLETPTFEAEKLVGKTAEDFTLPSTRGGSVSLNNYIGRPVLITFWASWDPACSEQISVLDELDTSDVVFLSISVQESLESVASLLRRGGYDRQSLVDEDGKLVEDYQIFDIPKHILIGEEGVIKKVKVGTMTKDEILSFVEL